MISLDPIGRIYEDRDDAGRKLADALAGRAEGHPLVLAIPRGGIPVAAAVARRLDADLDVVVVRKIGAPFQPELAMGAVTSTGLVVLNEDLIRQTGVDPGAIRSETERERGEAQAREARLREGRPRIDRHGRAVILVDDGLATGATMRAALRSVRAEHPSEVVVAVPVGSVEACADLREEGAEVVCLNTPEPFFAIGGYYARFEQVSDEEAVRLLRGGRPAVAVAS